MIPVLSRSRIVAIPAAEPAPTGLKRPKPDRWSPRYDAGWGYLSPPKMLTVLNATFPDVISSKLKAEDRRSKLQLSIEQVTIDTPIFAGMERMFCNCNRNTHIFFNT